MKHTVILYALPLFAVISTLSGCITPYDAGIESYPSLLVVEGIIVDGETKINLSRSVDINTNNGYLIDGVHEAQVWIEGENGDRFEAIETPWVGDYSAAEYIATGVILNDDVRYRLRISAEGQEYESDYRFPQSTPEIQSIDFHIEENSESDIEVRFNVIGEPDQSRYYLWSYEETWEYHSRVLASHHFVTPNPDSPTNLTYSFGDYLHYLWDDIEDNELLAQQYPDGLSPYYYCWNRYKSKEILLAATDLLSENILKDHTLYGIERESDRLQTLYHTKVFLYSIGEDAYYYFTNQKENTDQTGSIFAPIPTEMRGNIVNTTSPDVPVIGFVDVSRRVEKEEIFNPSNYYRPPWSDCFTLVDPDPENIPGGYTTDELFLVNQDQYSGSMTYAPIVCIDCRRSGGSKDRPFWWPNDHY